MIISFLLFSFHRNREIVLYRFRKCEGCSSVRSCRLSEKVEKNRKINDRMKERK